MSGADSLLAFRRNVVVAASAGTGKTHRLTALYVLLALGLTSMGKADESTAARPISPDRIVATTFSRAAAREIARRVERALVAVAAQETHPLEVDIAARAKVLRVDASELSERAKIALAKWPEARIDTLHGLARRIVVEHAALLGQGARVLDEHESEAIGTAAVDAALGNAMAAGGDPARAARAILTASGGVATARRRLLTLFDRLDEEGVEPTELALIDHASAARRARTELLAVARRSAASGCPKSRAPAAALAAALDGDVLRAFPALVELFAVRLPREADRNDADRALDALRSSSAGDTHLERAERLTVWLTEASRLGATEEAILVLLGDARERLASEKRKAGGLGFGDLLRLAERALAERADVARAARSEIDALLVDEFQDTSRVQKNLVYLLRERDNSGRAPGAPATAEHLVAHGLFLVGDRKQSIYGFRGADVAVFAATCAELGGEVAERALALPPSRAAREPAADFVALTTSRRAGGALLAFVNAFAELDFASGRAADGRPHAFEITYGPGEHLAPLNERRTEGSVALIRDDGTEPADADPIVKESRGAEREAFVAAAAVALELASGRAPRDVAILARRRATIPLVELALSRLSVPYVVAGRALYDTFEARDASALIRLIVDPRDRTALATVLRGPMVALSDPTLAALSQPGRGLTVAFGRGSIAVDPEDERARLEAFRVRFAAERSALLGLSTGEALSAAIRRFDLDRVLSSLPRAEPRLANLDRLVAIARARGGSLASFSRWLAARIDDEADEAEAAVFSVDDDAVRLTTIHASKGLDFPVVVLVDLNAEGRADPQSIGFVREDDASAPALVVRHYGARPGHVQAAATSVPVPITTPILDTAQIEARARASAERRRLTYVAMTRAAHKLVLVGPSELSRPRAGSAFRTLLEGIDGALAPFVTETLRASDVLAKTAPFTPRNVGPAAIEMAPPERAATSASRTVSIATTPLSIFAGCARRFRLRHLLGVDEPVARGAIDLTDIDDFGVGGDVDRSDPRALGRAAHRVLERWPIEAFGEPTSAVEVAERFGSLEAVGTAERARVAAAIARFLASPYAGSLRAADVAREVPFALELTPTAPGGRAMVVRGAIDLVARFADGRIDIIDYKLAAKPDDLSRYAFQLRTYALAATNDGARDVAAAAVHLFGDGAPAWLADGDRASFDRVALPVAQHAAFADELRALSNRVADARHDDRFDPVPVETCERLACGFVAACHGDRRTPSAVVQLRLFDG